MNIIEKVREIVANGKTPVFDCDQVLLDKGKWNTTLIEEVLAMLGCIKIASHGTTINKATFKYENVDHETVVVTDTDGMPVLDDQCRPVVAKALSDEYVLIDDRADEWAKHTGKTNYVQYVFNA